MYSVEYCAIMWQRAISLTVPVLCVHFIVSQQKRRDTAGGAGVKIGGLRRMEEVRRGAHLMNLLREAEG